MLCYIRYVTFDLLRYVMLNLCYVTCVTLRNAMVRYGTICLCYSLLHNVTSYIKSMQIHYFTLRYVNVTESLFKDISWSPKE